ncbi:MAG: MFS transporter [Propionibacteriaceae bacterium]|nr:MFS transporter [Propionibacteriaceae bacterium]
MVNVGIVLMISALYGSYGWAGFLAAANGLAWAAGNAVLSRLVDRHGQRAVMVPAVIVTSAGMAAFILAGVVHEPIWVLLIPCVISGATGGSASAMVRARWNHALDNSSQLNAAFALESTLDEVTYMIGPMVATLLATTIHPAAGLIAPIVLGVSGGLWFFQGLQASQPPVRILNQGGSAVLAVAGQNPPAPAVRSPVTLERDRFVLAFGGMVPVIAVTALFGCTFGAIDIAVVAATTDFGARGMAGVVLAALSLGSALAGLAYGAHAWKVSLARRFVIGVLAYAVLTALFLLAHSVAVLVAFGLFCGMAVAPSLTNANTLVASLVPRHRLTEGLAWIGTSIGVGASIGSSVAGRLIDDYGYVAGFLTAAVGTVAAFLISMLGVRALSRALGKRATSSVTD